MPLFHVTVLTGLAAAPGYITILVAAGEGVALDEFSVRCEIFAMALHTERGASDVAHLFAGVSILGFIAVGP